MAYLYKHKQKNHAFGLVELMVSISIMLLVMTVMLTRQSSFNGAVLLRNQAYEVAFSIRQAQLLAVTGTSTVERRYGIYFSRASTENTQYILFADTDGNRRYESSSDRQISIGRLDNRFQVRDILDGSNNLYSGASITFERPNFDANFRSNSGTEPDGPFYIDISRANVSTDGTGDVRRIEITTAGQISVTTK